MSTTLLPAAGRPAPGWHVRAGAAGALDVVHDHVLRLLGDAALAATVTADVALRAAGRATADDGATDLQAMLRSAHARMGPLDRRLPGPRLVGRLADGPAGRALVTGMAAAAQDNPHGAAVLDLTARRGLGVRDAAAVVGLDHATAARARTEALGTVRAHLAEVGASVDVDVPTALAHLPVLPAPDPVQDLLPAPATAPTRGPVHPLLAWTATAVVAVATVGGLVVGLPALAEADASDAPVVRAVAVEEGPAADQLTSPVEDRSAQQVERLVVGTQTSEVDDEQAQDDEQATSGTAPVEVEPSPEPTAEPEPEPTDAESPAPSEEPSEEPSEAPSEDPLDELLPGGDS